MAWPNNGCLSPRLRKASRPLSIITENTDGLLHPVNVIVGGGGSCSSSSSSTTTGKGKYANEGNAPVLNNASSKIPRAVPTRRKAVAPLQHPVTILLDGKLDDDASITTKNSSLAHRSVEPSRTAARAIGSSKAKIHIDNSNRLFQNINGLKNKKQRFSSSSSRKSEPGTDEKQIRISSLDKDRGLKTGISAVTKNHEKLDRNHNNVIWTHDTSLLNEPSLIGSKVSHHHNTSIISNMPTFNPTILNHSLNHKEQQDDILDYTSDRDGVSVTVTDSPSTTHLLTDNDHNNITDSSTLNTSNNSCYDSNCLSSSTITKVQNDLSQDSGIGQLAHTLDNSNSTNTNTNIVSTMLHAPNKDTGNNNNEQFYLSCNDNNKANDITDISSVNPDIGDEDNLQTCEFSEKPTRKDFNFLTSTPNPKDVSEKHRLPHWRQNVSLPNKLEHPDNNYIISSPIHKKHITPSSEESSCHACAPKVKCLRYNLSESDVFDRHRSNEFNLQENVATNLDGETLEWKKRVKRSTSLIKIPNSPKFGPRRRISLSNRSLNNYDSSSDIDENSQSDFSDDSIIKINNNNIFIKKDPPPTHDASVSIGNQSNHTEPIRRISAIDQSDFSLLKVTTNRLNLPTRRPSVMAWKEKYLNQRNFPFKPKSVENNAEMDKCSHNNHGNCDVTSAVSVETGDNSLVTKLEWKLDEEDKERINQSLAWLRQELIDIRLQDQSLARQFLNLRQAMNAFRLAVECEGHEELINDAEEDMEELRELSQLVDIPPEMLSSLSPLKHVGITRMNIISRRFSTC